jgi:hypothetical protein
MRGKVQSGSSFEICFSTKLPLLAARGPRRGPKRLKEGAGGSRSGCPKRTGIGPGGSENGRVRLGLGGQNSTKLRANFAFLNY